MNQKDAMKILSDLVKIRSVNDNELEVAQYLKNLFDQAGIESEILPLGGNRANLVATLGQGEPVLGVAGHMDVVDVEAQNWDSDPFEVVQKGDNLYGRGVADMKDGLAAITIAMIELKQNNVPLKGTLKFLATAGEEVGQIGSEQLTADGYMKDVSAMLVGEPTGYRIICANKGQLNLTVTSKGKAAHSSMPKLGNNAVEHLLQALQLMRTTFDKISTGVTNAVMGETLYNVDVINGGNQVNAIPGLATAKINLRTIPELPNAKIVAALQSALTDYNQNSNGQVELTVDMDVISTEGNQDSKLIKLIQTVGKPYMAHQNLSPEEMKRDAALLKMIDMPFSATEILTMSASGGTDASQYLVDQPVGFDYAVFGPGNDTQHQDNEYTSQQMYFDFIEIYQKLFTQYLA